MPINEGDHRRANWQVAPAEYEINNYDEPKIRYREYVENYIKPMKPGSLKKKTFFTIATNVACADISTKDNNDPLDKDLYLPLEIAITKWSLNCAQNEDGTRKLDSKLWMLNPGELPRGCINVANDFKSAHKIDFDLRNPDDVNTNPYVEQDVNKVMKEINSFLSADRTVFSQSIYHVRQDLGCLKWLNSKATHKSNPISVFNLEDLYVVMSRFFNPELDNTCMGQGIAHYRLNNYYDSYDTSLQCLYHQIRAKNFEDGSTDSCAKALAYSRSNVMIEDILRWTF